MKKLQFLVLVFLVSSVVLIAQEKMEKLGTKVTKQSVSDKAVTPSAVNKPNGTAAVTSYDFTTGSGQYYGGAAGAVEVETGVWAMIAGDANSDGTVNSVDYNSHWLTQNGTTWDYTKFADFNLDGTINSVDYNSFWLPNNSKATQVP